MKNDIDERDTRFKKTLRFLPAAGMGDYIIRYIGNNKKNNSDLQGLLRPTALELRIP
jgi:hypothetical protein